MNFDSLTIIISIILLIIALVGSIFPVIPGTILAWLAILLLKFTHFGNYFSWWWIFWFGILVIINKILDYLVPIWGIKKFGGSKFGIYGSVLGLIIGLFFPPIGFILGPFIGAFLGEIFFTQNSHKTALKASFGTFLGMLTGILLNLIIVIIHITFFCYILIKF